MSDFPPPIQGLVAGKYQIMGLIGRGGMGSVWEGRHTSLGTRVAVKFIDPEYAESKEACARFVTEARAAATIQSKHAIQIFDHGVTDNGRPYMVMELLVGEPLDKRIERLGTLTLPETARIIGHVCRALQRAHDAGIIHRDLKPENIFLVRTPDDDDEISKVLDFGIAKIKALPGEEGLTSSTKTGAVLGTPYYMSPEQARGLRTIDHRSDLWSLGIIAHKCVTGILPFEGESVGDLLVKICTSPPPTPSMTAPGLPQSFDAWFARALEREPSRRFASATELSEALALAAGLSTRTVVSSRNPRAPAPSAQAGTALANATPLPSAGVTSAALTSAAGVPGKSSRGAVVAATIAALLGGSIGVVAVIKLTSHGPIEKASASMAAPTMALDGVAGTSAPNVPTAAHSPTSQPSAASSPSSKTAESSPSSLTAAPVVTAAKATLLLPAHAKSSATSPRPAPAKPSPNLADPGY